MHHATALDPSEVCIWDLEVFCQHVLTLEVTGKAICAQADCNVVGVEGNAKLVVNEQRLEVDPKVHNNTVPPLG